jgi:hypothetical protein
MSAFPRSFSAFLPARLAVLRQPAGADDAGKCKASLTGARAQLCSWRRLVVDLPGP